MEKEYPYVEDGWVYFNEACIVEQFVSAIWNRRMKGRYVELGYEFTKMNDKMRIDIRHLPEKSNAKVSVLCPICYESRISRFGDITRHWRTRCRKCVEEKKLLGKVFNRLTVIELLPSKNGHVMWLCLCECGNLTEVSNGNLRRGNTTSCGCYSSEQKRLRFGSDHPSWNPDLTDEERINGRGWEIREWSMLIKEKDNYTCQTCGDGSGDNLQSHHLNNYKDFPDERVELNNGVTLCKNCHTQFHSWMGNVRVSSTVDDFISFCKENYPNALFLQNI